MAYYSNITGIVRGQWYRIPKQNAELFDPPENGLDEDSFPKRIPPRAEWGNFTYLDKITGHSGKFSLDLSELHMSSTIQFVEATLYVGNTSGDKMYHTKLQGVHFPKTGDVVLVSTSPKK